MTLLQAAEKMIEDLEGLMRQTDGVAGLFPDCEDLVTWDDLMGDMSPWLGDAFNDLKTAIEKENQCESTP